MDDYGTKHLVEHLVHSNGWETLALLASVNAYPEIKRQALEAINAHKEEMGQRAVTIVTVELVIDSIEPGEIADTVSSLLTSQDQIHGPEDSKLVDWQYLNGFLEDQQRVVLTYLPEDYAEGDAFKSDPEEK